MENLINYEILKSFINYKNINEKVRIEKIDTLIQNINIKLDLLNNKQHKYNVFYSELVKLLNKFKDPKFYGQSANFNIDDIKILEKNFNNFNENIINDRINKIKLLLTNFNDKLPSYIEETNKKFTNFDLEIKKLKDYLNNYKDIYSKLNSITYNLQLLNQEKKYTNEQQTIFNNYKQQYKQLELELFKLNEYLKNIKELSIKIFKDWGFDNLNAGIRIFYNQENDFKEILNLLEEIQFTDNINLYKEILQSYKDKKDEFYKIQNRFNIDNLKKNIKTKENLNILNEIQKINIKILNENNINIQNNITSIENKINKQSQSKFIISFKKKGKGDTEINIFLIILTGILLILIFIIEKFNINIPEYLGIIIGFFGSMVLFYGLYKGLYKLYDKYVKK